VKVGKWSIILVVLVSILPLAVVDVASASESPPVYQPRITNVTSTAVCPVVPCSMQATLIYNVAVNLHGNVAGDFAVVDLTSGSTCQTQTVTPSPVVAGGTRTLLLGAICAVSTGDRMNLTYTGSAVAYVVNARNPRVRALSPQTFQWIMGRVVGCPPLCTPR
jgi:hypothetical protein